MNKAKVESKSLERHCGLLAKLCLTLETPWTIAHQAPLFMGFSKQEYWSRLPFSSPGDLSNPGIKPRSPPIGASWALSKYLELHMKSNRESLKIFFNERFFKDIIHISYDSPIYIT